MRLYWDTSGLIRALRQGDTPVGVTRPHTVAEFFAILTGPGVAMVEKGKTVKHGIPPAQALQAVEHIFKKLEFYELGGGETINAVKESVPLNIQGRNIHDWLHCKAAEAAKADRIVTLNWKDFGAMTKLPLAQP